MTKTAADSSGAEEVKRIAFLDTNVIVEFARGVGAATKIFDKEIKRSIRFAINHIVLQELMIVGTPPSSTVLDIINREEIEILPIRKIVSDESLERAGFIVPKRPHANELLIFSSAVECDFLITGARAFEKLAMEGGPVVITPSAFVDRYTSAP